MKIGIAAIQCRIADFGSTERLVSTAEGIQVLLLPEYFSLVGLNLIEESRKGFEFIERLSREYDCIIAGNGLEKRDGRAYNSLYVFDSGELIGVQEKLHPTKVERNMGVCSGSRLKVFDVRGVKFASLVCADILYPEICRVAGLKGADIVFNPVVSFKKSEFPAQNLRSCIYFTRSFDNAYAVVKAGGIGRTFTGTETAGRSLISTFKGIAASYTSEDTEELVWAEVDVSLIREYRRANYSLHDRNIDAYSELLRP